MLPNWLIVFKFPLVLDAFCGKDSSLPDQLSVGGVFRLQKKKKKGNQSEKFWRNTTQPDAVLANKTGRPTVHIVQDVCIRFIK